MDGVLLQKKSISSANRFRLHKIPFREQIELLANSKSSL